MICVNDQLLGNALRLKVLRTTFFSVIVCLCLNDLKGIDLQFFCFRWVTLLFTQEFEMPEVIQLWDSILSQEKRRKFIAGLCCSFILYSFFIRFFIILFIILLLPMRFRLFLLLFHYFFAKIKKKGRGNCYGYFSYVIFEHRNVKSFILSKTFAEIIELLQHYPVVDLRKIIKATLTIKNTYKDANDAASSIPIERPIFKRVFLIPLFSLLYIYF